MVFRDESAVILKQANFQQGEREDIAAEQRTQATERYESARESSGSIANRGWK